MPATETRKNFWLVWNASPHSTDLPTKMHFSYDEAYTEAERLAKKNPGKDYFVMVASAGVVSEVTTKKLYIARQTK